MLKKILLIVPSPESRFRLYRYFFQGMIDSFRRLGVDCRVVEGDNGSAIQLYREVIINQPDCTLCFNGFIPEEGENFLCDELEVPHIAFLLDPPTRFLTMLKSKHTIVTCMDRSFCAFYNAMQVPEVGQAGALFMPHAVSRDLHIRPDTERPIDVLFMATCYDFEGERKLWEKRYSSQVAAIMEKACEMTFQEPYTSFIEAFTRTLKASKGVDPKQLDWRSICYDIETYIKGYDRVKLIEAVQKVAHVHIYGSPQRECGWETYFPQNAYNVTIHDGVSMEESGELMKRAKVVLNSCPTVKDGTHERIFMGLASGALVCTSENRYLQEQFKEGDGIIFFPFADRACCNEKIERYLKDEAARVEAVNRGFTIVQQNHTWDSRVKSLQTLLPPILERFIESN
ncbi:MAG: glycosyltransferase family 1 protein [Verrucomicrobia bacterium]|nr:glycosyltransferase family 1 protein [Verrucomicrobiota bacterium]